VFEWPVTNSDGCGSAFLSGLLLTVMAVAVHV
jgi:hypothetical protein